MTPLTDKWGNRGYEFWETVSEKKKHNVKQNKFYKRIYKKYFKIINSGHDGHKESILRYH